MPVSGPSGDLQYPTAELLVAAYCRGLFPMVDARSGCVEWFSPDPRGVIPLGDFHVPRSLARRVRCRPFELRTNTCFEDVMRACAEPRPGREETWIDDRLLAAYVELHERGGAHTIEAWIGEQLVGGLYGVQLGGAFLGESMFSRPELGGTDSSKVCLVQLVDLLRVYGFRLLDTQFSNAHLGQFGCVEIPRASYLLELGLALEVDALWPAAGLLEI